MSTINESRLILFVLSVLLLGLVRYITVSLWLAREGAKCKRQIAAFTIFERLMGE